MLELYRLPSEAAMPPANDDTISPHDRAAFLISEILTKAWPSDTPGATSCQLGYLKGLLTDLAARDDLLLDQLERHRDHIARNNRELGLT